MNAPVIYIFNLKGGVAKTTTAVNLASVLGEMGKRTLVVDLDPQCAATWSLGISPQNIANSTYSALMGKKPFPEIIKKSNFANVSVAPASEELYGLDIDIQKVDSDWETLLTKALEPVKRDYDAIVIDSHNKYGFTEVNALVASDYLVIPVSCSILPFWGLNQLHHLIDRAEAMYGHHVDILGYLLTMFHRKIPVLHSESKDIERQLRAQYADKVFTTVIDFDENIDQATWKQEPIAYYQRHAKGSKEFDQLGQEVIERISNGHNHDPKVEANKGGVMVNG
jgi:chromosome partitioning protein